jgi:hypothetical protein
MSLECCSSFALLLGFCLRTDDWNLVPHLLHRRPSWESALGHGGSPLDCSTYSGESKIGGEFDQGFSSVVEAIGTSRATHSSVAEKQTLP